MFLSRREQRLYEIRFVWIQKDVGEKRGTIRTHWKKCCLWLNGVSTENQKRTSVLQIRRDFSPTRDMTRINVILALSSVKLLISSWKIYICATWWHGIPKDSGDSYGHKLCSTYSRLVFILLLYESDFMSNHSKSKRFDLIDEFNDTSWYLDDIFTVDNPEFAEHIPDIYPRELLRQILLTEKYLSWIKTSQLLVVISTQAFMTNAMTPGSR